MAWTSDRCEGLCWDHTETPKDTVQASRGRCYRVHEELPSREAWPRSKDAKSEVWPRGVASASVDDKVVCLQIDGGVDDGKR